MADVKVSLTLTVDSKDVRAANWFLHDVTGRNAPITTQIQMSSIKDWAINREAV